MQYTCSPVFVSKPPISIWRFWYVSFDLLWKINYIELSVHKKCRESALNRMHVELSIDRICKQVTSPKDREVCIVLHETHFILPEDKDECLAHWLPSCQPRHHRLSVQDIPEQSLKWESIQMSSFAYIRISKCTQPSPWMSYVSNISMMMLNLKSMVRWRKSKGFYTDQIVGEYIKSFKR